MEYFTPIAGKSYTPPATSHGYGLNLMHARLASDPLFLADVTIENAVIGSRYLLLDAANPSRVLSSGVVSSDPFIVSNVPGYSNPFLLELRLRKASSTPFYKPLTTFANHVPQGVRIYVVQVLDE